MVRSYRYIIYFVFALAALAIGVSAVSRLFIKADLPFEYGSSRHESFVESDFAEITKGDRIVAVDNIPVESAFEIEIIIDSKLPGDIISVTIAKGSSVTKSLPVTLVKYYDDNLFIIVTAIAGYAFWILGVFVIGSKPNDRAAVLLFLTLVTFSVAIFTTSGYYGRGSDWIGYFDRISHVLSYVWGSVFFLQFMMNFPFTASKRTKHFTYLIYMAIVLFSIVASYTCYVTLRDLNTDWHIVNENIWKVSEMLLFACLITGTLILIFKYLKIRNAETKRKIEWIFWGMALGVGPFIIFWLIPNIFELKYLIREEFILAFLLVVPVSFAIAVVKYHIFDIEVIIKRSLIYFFLIGILIFLYFEVIFISSNYFEKYFGYESKVFYILAAILIALMLNPLRIKIKGFVDKMFYREKYAFDKAIQKVTSVTKECHTYEELGNRILEEISTLIPVKSIAIVSTTLMRDRIRILSQNNFDLLQKNIGAFRVKNLLSRIDLPFSMAQKIEPGILFNSKLEAILKRWQIALIVPLSFDSSETVGAIVMGDKLSGLRYSQSDLQLLNTIASSTALSIKRMELQEKLFMEEVELEKANELSELKSYFVASISHDLKTPLAAIKIFTELLQNDNITKEKTREYLSIIEGETERLKRMIDNVLNFSKIEKGLKQFNFRKINLNEATNIVMNRMNYELNMQKFKIDKSISSEPLYINGDPDAIASILENLISNSIKYSEKNKFLRVSTKRHDGNAEVIVEDAGRGISESNLRNIFDPFYREVSAEKSNVKGAGLGLAIVRNVVEAHNGNIEVQSEVGHGSKFQITFPEYINGRNDTDYNANIKK